MARGPLSAALARRISALQDPSRTGEVLRAVGEAWAAAANEMAPQGPARQEQAGQPQEPPLRGNIRFEAESPTRGYLVLPAHGLYVELGTRSHLIRSKSGRMGKNGRPAALRFSLVGGSNPFFARVVRHPGTKADPFLDRAWHSAQVQDVLQRAVGDLLAHP